MPGARWRVVHAIGYRFAEPANGAELDLKLTPRAGSRQELAHHQLLIEPRPVAMSTEADAHDNVLQRVTVPGPFRALAITAISTVTLAPPLALDPAASAELQAILTRARVETRPARVARAGLCRERTETALSLLRSAGVVCRYHSGYALPAKRGRTLPHAWLSLELPGRGFVEYDPTSCTLPGAHVRVAIGHGYDDVAPVAGRLGASGAFRLVSTVDVEPLGSRPAT